MATLVLSTVGQVFGGPIGGLLGTFVGGKIDRAVFGSRSNEGPRLEELKITTSSYGQPIVRHHGRVRAPGTIIWARDLTETRETGGGGKGKPKTTTFSYSGSFAVALASRPISEVRRIWADGNLLRGAAGDLKVGGTLRVHRGYRDQAPDPLIASNSGLDGGGGCPAYRGCAYAVFEDLELADYGNRIPALTFEVVADDGAITLTEIVQPLVPGSGSDLAFPELTGFTVEGGSIAQSLAALDQVYPIAIGAGGGILSLGAAADGSSEPVMLPPAASAWEDGDFGGPTGRSRTRETDRRERPHGLRYYDVDRDFLPGLQRAEGRSQPGGERILEFPAALNATNARSLANAAAQRASWRRERLSWRLAELDPALIPGAVVTVPDMPGQWRITGWEWRERGVELELERLPPVGAAKPAADSGQSLAPPDDIARATLLEAFELPWDGTGSRDSRSLFAAAGAAGPGWRGAALYKDAGGALLPIAATTRRRSTIGALAEPLPPAQSMLLDQCAQITVELLAEDMGFTPASIAGLARGVNRLLVGSEVVQFAQARQVAPSRWQLSALLRGRGGTEYLAQAGHDVGTRVVLIDDTLVPLDAREFPAGTTATLAAIGHGDEEPVSAAVTGIGTTLRPLAPVHPVARKSPDGSLGLRWTRRARGAWGWPDEVDTPLVEQTEAYLVGLGPVDAPLATWQASEPELSLPASTIAGLHADHSGQPLWVRQIGSHAQSNPLLLTMIR